MREIVKSKVDYIEKINKKWWKNEPTEGYTKGFDDPHKWGGGYIVSAEIPKNSKVLELGCAKGSHGAYLIKEKSCEVYGIDVFDEVIKIAKSKGVNAIKHDLNKLLPYGDGEFDVVLASHVLEHIYNLEQLVDECYRVLKKGGKIVAVIPNYNNWRNRYLTLFGSMHRYVTGGDMRTFSSHLQQLNYDRVMYLFSKSNFISVKIKPVGRIGKIFPKLAGSFVAICEK